MMHLQPVVLWGRLRHWQGTMMPNHQPQPVVIRTPFTVYGPRNESSTHTLFECFQLPLILDDEYDYDNRILFNDPFNTNVTDRHISIQTKLEGLEVLTDLNGAGRKACPLCPEEKFKACYSHKLRRHLQNLHWKVYVEFEAPSGQAYEIMKELGTNVQLMPNHTTPQKTDTYFNRKMKTNRQLVFCSLAVLAEERNPLESLDAFGATGIMGLQWAKHLRNAVKVTITDINEVCVKMIRENCNLNHIRVEGSRGSSRVPDGGAGDVDGVPIATVEVAKMDANVIMHLRSFDYIHLDPFGTAVNYLDSAFRNIRNLGIISVTSTDTGSLYSKSLNVTMRHYGSNIVRTEYYKELAARMVLATVARAAARCNKGIEVLLAVAVEHFVLVVVRVLRGPTQADESAKRIRQLIHCQWCEERVFLKLGSMVEENLYRQLPCNCHGSMPGKTAVELGPLWSGPLFNSGFLRRMLFAAVQHSMEDIQPLVKTLICESECTTLKSSVHGPTALINQGKRKTGDEPGNVVKKLKSDGSLEHPAFYYGIHRHSIRGMNMPKLNRFLQYLTEAGFRVSRTHFDPTGVRTDATLDQFKSVLTKYSVPTYTNTTATQNPEETVRAME
uniref:tRNA (guanine(26)-N(2))-dimethyltransferase n=1 Tax=Oncorhynchus tshawytscha TaxID=74940 RepID=A0AAZ3SXD9_ONCTS